MPDFEALIRHQQDQQPTTKKRLKVVDKQDFDNEKSNEPTTSKSGLLVNIFGGFIVTYRMLSMFKKKPKKEQKD